MLGLSVIRAQFYQSINLKAHNQLLFYRNWFTNRRILFLDQGISAFTNYFPLLIPVYLGRWENLGQLVFFLSFYVLFLGVSRSAFGVSQLIHDNRNQSRQLLLLGFLYSIASGLLTFPFLKSIYENSLFMILVFVFPILQDILRFEFLGRDSSEKVLVSDAIWIFSTMMLFAFSPIMSSNLTLTLIICWSVGSAPAFAWLWIERIKLKSVSPTQSASRMSHKYLSRMAFTSVLADVNTIYVNWIITIQSSTVLLGNFRFYQLIFLPVAFLINFNRIALIPLFRDKKELSIGQLLKSEARFRIIIYSCGFLFIISKVEFTAENILAAIFTAAAIEFAFKRNTKYQNLLANQNETKVLKNLLLYLALSITLFAVTSRLGEVLFLSLTLLFIELISYMSIPSLGASKYD